MTDSTLHLDGGLRYADLHDPTALAALDGAFRARLAADDAALSATFESYRSSRGLSVTGAAESQLLIAVGAHLERFIARLFGVEAAAEALHRAANDERAVMRMKKELWRKRGQKLLTEVEASGDTESPRRAMAAVLAAFDVPATHAEDEVAVGRVVTMLLDLEDRCGKVLARGGATVGDDELALLDRRRSAMSEGARAALAGAGEGAMNVENAKALLGAILGVIARGMAAIALEAGKLSLLHTTEGPQSPSEGRSRRRGWVSFKTPQPVDPKHLVHAEHPDPAMPELSVGPAEGRRARDGFSLTDARGSRLEIANEVDYCILCHDREKDSCRRGLAEPPPKGEKAPPAKSPKELGRVHPSAKNPKIKLNVFGSELSGCPLEERIGEMHALRAEGRSIAALAVICIDHPTCAGTGHRICNDCMKGCIYQKQDPVNIPQAETGALTDVLALPWGVEIYGLLTRWNPLNARRPYALPYNGKNVLVVGLGPAGYTLSQHLLNEGFGVVAIDGLKLEPMDEALVGSSDRLPTPIADYAALRQDLAERKTLGFGGVAEYGITIRWDKNFLDLVALGLLRRRTFRMYGGIRFGGTLTLEDAWKLGFHHVAIAAGAGKPTLVDIPNGLARGVRQASDFLMGLQLTGAFKRDSLANMQVRLPAVVIGGGLTAIDTATELSAYYVVQVERTLARHEALVAGSSEDVVMAAFDAEEREIIEEQLAHGRRVREERELARREGRAPRFAPLIEEWGGVTIAYRRTLEESPAYRLNHEEIIKAFEEGARFAASLSPKEVVVDERGAAKAMRFTRGDAVVELPARTICIAAGTSPNVTYEREHPGTFVMDAKTKAFRPHDVTRGPDGKLVASDDPLGFFTSYCDGEHAVSFYGDNLPRYAGSVVKAMASAKDGYPHVVRLFESELAQLDPAAQPARESAWRSLVSTLDSELVATVHEVIRLAPTIVEVIVRAPAAARGFQPGQFYRLQNFESDAPVVGGTRLLTEGLALTGAWVDKERGLLSTVVLEIGASSRLCSTLKKGQPVVLMGPTGAPTEIPANENVVLVGGGLGNAVLFSIGQALRARGSKVVYFAGYRNPDDVFHQDDIEKASDMIVWAADRAPAPPARRPSDSTFVGNIVAAMTAYARGDVGGAPPFPLSAMDRMIVIGSDKMMAAVKAARAPGGVLHPFVKPEHHAVASVNSPMQCMMKEICAQCLQRQVDPVTGKVSIVFTCYNQDQSLDAVDFPFLASRLRASSATEKLADLWLSHLIRQERVAHV
jgi:NADPH-dependent glutamate synthase beta subunit-like oxidoreductase/NAD(P)H-flavin reductase